MPTRLCPSHDRVTLTGLEPGQTLEERHKPNPDGFLYIRNVVFGQIREMGVSEEIIKGLCVDGPRNFFEGV